MAIYHVLADGTRTNDITGHVVKVSEVANVYQLMIKLNKRLQNDYKSETNLKDRRVRS